MKVKILEYFLRSIEKGFAKQKSSRSLKNVNLSTQYLVGASLAQTPASVRSGSDQPVALLSLQLVWIDCFSSFSWKYPMDSLTIKHSNTMVIEPAFGTFVSVGRCQVLLENEISISIKLVNRRKHEEVL